MTDLEARPLIQITELLDDHIESLEEPRPPDGMYHPSSLHFCDRKVIYEVRGVEPTNPPDATAKRRFRIGHLIHELVQGAIAESPKVKTFYPEFGVLIPGLRITGHGDGLIELADGTSVKGEGGEIIDLPDGSWLMLEAKSARASSFKFGLKSGHVEQASDYAIAVRDGHAFIENEDGTRTLIPALGEKLVGILVFYQEKEDARTAEYFVPFDDAWRTAQAEHIEKLEPYRLDPESLPPRLKPMKVGRGKPRKPWQCNPKWCPVYDRCMTDPAKIEPADPNEW